MREMGDVGVGALGRLAFGVGVFIALMAVVASPAQAGKAWIFDETFGPSNQPGFSGQESTLAVDGSGRLYVFEHDGTDTITRWNADGTPAEFAALSANVIDGAVGGLDETPQGSIGGGDFDQVAVDNSCARHEPPLTEVTVPSCAEEFPNDGNIYVGDRFDNLVNVFDEDGTFLGQLTASGSGPFDRAGAVAVDDAGAIYVGDEQGAAGAAVHKYEPAVKPPANADNTATFSTQSAPRQLAAGDGPTDGYIFAATNAALLKMDAGSGIVDYAVGDTDNRLVSVEPITGHVFSHDLGTNFTEYDASGVDAATEVTRREDVGGASVLGIAPFNAGQHLYLHRAGLTNVQIWEAVLSQEVVTGPPSLISGGKTTVTGTVMPFGTDISDCHFAYVSDADYNPGSANPYAAGDTVPCEPDADSIPIDNGTHQVTGELTGLLAQGTTYHYRLVTNGVAPVNGEDETFETANTYSTEPATDITGLAATLKGIVKPEGVALTDCYFEYGTFFFSSRASCEPEASSIPPVDADVAVSADVTGLGSSTVYRARLIAVNALGQITTSERSFTTVGRPLVEQQPTDVTETSATLLARINPAGSDTSYHFEWANQVEFEEGKYGNRVPINLEGEAGEGTVPVIRKGFVSGLQPASTYHFRVIATNTFGTTEGGDQPFETLGTNGLSEDRAIELVSPADKGPAGSVAGGVISQLTRQSSENGESMLYPIQNGIPESTVGGWTRWVATRGNDGWLSSQVSAPSLVLPPQQGFTYPSRVFYASPDLSCALLQSYNPLTADTPPIGVELGVQNLYRWNKASGAFELISDRLPINPEAISADNVYHNQIETSDDCSRIYFRSVYELIDGGSGIYEWEAGTLRDAGKLPNGSVGAGAVIGGEVVGGASAPYSRENAVSADGRRLFFSAISNEGANVGERAVFMRENTGSETIVTDISQSETPTKTNGARFEVAADDGNRVFFVANYGIADGEGSDGPTNGECGTVSDAADAPIETKPCDLYTYDVGSGELSAISNDENENPIGAAVQGVVDIDEDGSHVYFAALGQLVPGKGRTYGQNISGEGSANVYLANGGELGYVATLDRADLLGGGGSALMRKRLAWSAAASSDGNRLALESADDLTGQKVGGGKAAYVYDAGKDDLLCISCPPNGQAATTAAATPMFVSGRSADITYRPRTMSNDGGRLFFSSPDVLATGGEMGVRSSEAGFAFDKFNVYQWQDGQVTLLSVVERSGGGGLGTYLDASSDGHTVFVATKEQLTEADKDFVADAYAIRVGGGYPKDPDPVPCQVDDSEPLLPNQVRCQELASPEPDPPDPTSAGFAGTGDVKQPPVGTGPCRARARRALMLSRRAKALRRKARASSSPKAKRRHARSARRAARAARRNSAAAKRCRKERAANPDLGGAR